MMKIKFDWVLIRSHKNDPKNLLSLQTPHVFFIELRYVELSCMLNKLEKRLPFVCQARVRRRLVFTRIFKTYQNTSNVANKNI